MKIPPFSRQSILSPQAFDVDKGALTLAELDVLKGRERNEFVFGVHAPIRYTKSCNVIPCGSPSVFTATV